MVGASENIRMSNERLEELIMRFLTDRRIATLNLEIAAIYSISIPKYILTIYEDDDKEDDFKIVYSDKVEYEVKRVRSIIAGIIRSEYSEIIKEDK